MDLRPKTPPGSPATLFQVYLRLRPPPSPLVQLTQQSLYPSLPPPERYLTVEPVSQILKSSNHDHATAAATSLDRNCDAMPTQITINPPSDSRKRSVERFAFTKVFEEQAEQIDIFRGTGVVGLVEGVLGEGRDGLVATLGVTGSGKSHTILGSKTQRGMTQLSLDLLYRSLGDQVLHTAYSPSLVASLCATDASEAQIFSAQTFLDNVYGDVSQGHSSRAQTPMTVGPNSHYGNSQDSHIPKGKESPSRGLRGQWSILSLNMSTSPQCEEATDPLAKQSLQRSQPKTSLLTSHPVSAPVPFWKRMTRTQAKMKLPTLKQDSHFLPNPTPARRRLPQRPSALPLFPDISSLRVGTVPNAEYCVLVSMYEVYNDRIFDLLSVPSNAKDLRRRHLLFKSTEASPDRKVVAGLRKVVCGSYEEALMVLETGLHERRVAGTGSNSVSSRSHGFFCVEVKRRVRGGMSNSWTGATLTVVDLAGSERARNARTAGQTLQEAGKINESLMYLGQCLQMQSDQGQEGAKPSLVPFRQCKLTELLFSNSFPSPSHHANHPHSTHHHRNPQKGIMIVTADPVGDYNATSQILRYSALAREVTVPRIPSVSSTILAGLTNTPSETPGQRVVSNASNSNGTKEEMVEMAFSEIARLNEEVEILNVRLTEEEGRRKEAEENWQRAEDKAEIIEMETRETCWEEVETKMADERRRWVAAWGEETDRNEAHLDKKLDLFTQGMQIHEDPEDASMYTQQLENENGKLRRRLDTLERELQCRSPTKIKTPIKLASSKLSSPNPGDDTDDHSDILSSTLFNKMREMSLGPSSPPRAKTPGTAAKKMRKLTARKWDLMDENEMDGYGMY